MKYEQDRQALLVIEQLWTQSVIIHISCLKQAVLEGFFC